ncbi:MAG: AsnC family transcriptional regulator [Promethearchaeota archaeon]
MRNYIPVIDKIDKKLVNLMQNDFPLSRTPYQDIAKKIGIDRDEVITRLIKLYESDIIRKIGAILSARKIGYITTLAAVSVSKEQLDKVANIINSYDGVTHNYLREGMPNIWFTLTEPNQKILDKHLRDIERKINNKIIRMPAKKIFKIGVKFAIR